MSLGFLKLINDEWRWRFVKPGYDANDLTLPANVVIFDSASTEFLSVFASGTLTIVNGNNGKYKAITWPDLGYVPHAWAAFKAGGTFVIPVLAVSGSSTITGDVEIMTDGISVETRGLNYPADLDYIVFRVPVV